MSELKVAHLTTVDLSLRYLVFPQLLAVRDMGGEPVGISSPGPFVSELEAAGIRHVALESSTRGMDVLADLRSARELWSVLRRERPDVLHTHNPKPGLYGRIIGRMAGVPIVVNTIHGLYATPDDPFAKRAVVYLLETIASRFSDVELVQSTEDYDLITRLRIAAPHKTRHLGNGVDLDRFDPGRYSETERARLREELGAQDNTIVVGIVGRLVAEKGYPELFEAAKRLDDRFLVVCVGPEDPDKSDAMPRAMIEQARHTGVRFLGMRTDVERLYAAMDLFVLPSHREGFPRAAMEAAAMGLPIVATDIRGCREVVEGGETGILFPVGDVDALIGAIVDLGGVPQRRMQMSAAAAKRARDRFDEREVVKRVVRAYADVAAAKGMPWPTGDADDTTFRPATPGDAPIIARLHQEAIASGFLPRLGHRFMTLLYRALIEWEDGWVYVADLDTVIGFVAGVADTGGFYRYFLRRWGIRAFFAALPQMWRPAVIRRAWETLRYGTEGGVERSCCPPPSPPLPVAEARRSSWAEDSLGK